MASRKGSGARRRRSILDDPRYVDFVRRYRHDWTRFFVEALNFSPTHQQRQILDEIQVEGARVTVSSGHGTGKSDSSAGAVIAFMTCYYDARVVLTANNAKQVRIGVWKYLQKHWNALLKSYPWFSTYFTLTDTMFYCNEAKASWAVAMKSCRLGQYEALAGEHADRLLVIVDEASGVPDAAFGVMTGAFTSPDNRMLLLSQPTRPTGYFYDTHHVLAEKGRWTPLVLSSEESPIVTAQFLIDKLVEYGGRDSPEYLIKVRGEFPTTVAGMLLSKSEVDRAARREITLPKGWGWLATCDVGNGRDKSIINICRVWGEGYQRLVVNHKLLVMPSNVDPDDFGDVINAECSEDKYPNITIGVDGDGVGFATIKKLRKHGRNVKAIHWGKKPFTKEEKKRFINDRAKANILARDSIQQGRMKPDNSYETAEQASKIPCGLNDTGAYVIMPKKMMREKFNIKSPDQWDTYCFTQLMSYVPAKAVVSDSMKREREEAKNWVTNGLDDILDDDMLIETDDASEGEDYDEYIDTGATEDDWIADASDEDFDL